ncbi:conserved exported protein of unknown function [Maridesulfovibrio hydrothermalis AM13 = DSM 14728]|uniref:Uncharacterized protein n=2 Tax=Maridesulfovibrio TaxID=2794998 RepID=L0R954_9BACT|nr:conserved exported protein of unknown function [Maridesulfovibrio hydrothermalis AM13 = DSM 14728]
MGMKIFIFKEVGRIAISLMLLLSISTACLAVEYNENAAQDEQQAPLDASHDTSVQAAQAAVAIPQPPSQPAMDIDSMVDQFLGRAGYMQGWNAKKDTFIAVGTSVLDSEDPSYDDSFMIKRSLKSMEATLDAKAQIIEFIRTDMSVMDQASTPGTDLNAKFKEKIDKLERKIDNQRKKLVALLREVDAAEAAVLEGATFGDRLNRLMDAAIKKLDTTYSSAQIEEKKKIKFEKAKARYQKARMEYSQTEAKLKALVGSKTETLKSSVETMSAMPLMGGTVLAQFEEWNSEDEKFRTAIIMMWSKKMETIVRKYISGEKMTVPPGKMSIAEYINNNDWSSSTGGRRFRDNEGNVYFIGIGAAAVGSSASSEKRARGIASANAKKEVATAIFADVSSHKKAEQMMESYNGGTGKDTSIAAESFASELSQSMKNRNITGMQRFYSRKIKHPISGQTIYVSIYGVSGQSARQALLMEESNYLTRIMDVKSQQVHQGTKDGYEAAVQKTSADKTSYNQAKARSGSVSTPVAKAQSVPLADPSSSGGAGGSYAGAGQDDASW